MGEVWRAQDRDLESPCAIKFILEHLAKDSALRSRFTREAKTVARLRSPHAVQILGVGEHEGALYLAMELLEGETLHQRMSRVGTLSAEATFTMVEQVAHALAKAHEMGIVHRDLKPDNIWLWSERDVFAKVLDFGVAKTRNTTNSLHTATGMLVGTPHYMSPEQAKGTREVDHRTDLWALAIITIECLTGRRPFESQGLGDLLIQIVATPPPTLRALGADLPLGLQVWWERALAREPERRFQTAGELVAELRPHLAPNSKPVSMPGSLPQHASQPRLSSERGSERNSDVARQGSGAQPRAATPAPAPAVAHAVAASGSTTPGSGPRTNPDAAPSSTWVTAKASPGSASPGSASPGSASPGSARPGSAPTPGSMSPLSHTRVPRTRLSKPVLISIAAAAAIGLVLVGVVGARMFSAPRESAESSRGSRDARGAADSRGAGPRALPKVSLVPVAKPSAGAAPVVSAPVPAVTSPAVTSPAVTSPAVTSLAVVAPVAAGPIVLPRPSTSRPAAVLSKPVSSKPAAAPRPPKTAKPGAPSVEDKYGI